MQLLRAAVVASLGFLAPSQTGCGLTCTLIGGWDGLHLDVEGTLAPDQYTVVVRAEERELRVEVEILDGGTRCATPCNPRVALGDGRELFVEASLWSNGGSLIVGIGNDGGPDHVEVDLLRGDVLIAREVYEPEYVTTYPNGRGCAPALTQAQGTLVVPQ